jgi:hypothetical protein
LHAAALRHQPLEALHKYAARPDLAGRPAGRLAGWLTAGAPALLQVLGDPELREKYDEHGKGVRGPQPAPGPAACICSGLRLRLCGAAQLMRVC